MAFTVREATWNNDKEALSHIREIVFIEEQNVPQELEWDDRDSLCWHVLVENNSKPIATGRLDKNGKIGRMAVLKEFRGQRVGLSVLNQLKLIARREGIRKTFLHAQCHAIDFYLKNGYRAIGDIYKEAGISHKNAEELLEIESFAFSDAIAFLCDSVRLANKQLSIKLSDINHPLLCHADFVSTLKNKCLNSRNFSVNILLEKTRPNKRSDEFVRSYQRLTDKISIRIFKVKNPEADKKQFLVIDNNYIAWQTNPDYSDLRILRASNRIKSFQENYAAAWNTSERDLSLLKLYI